MKKSFILFPNNMVLRISDGKWYTGIGVHQGYVTVIGTWDGRHMNSLINLDECVKAKPDSQVAKLAQILYEQ